MSLRPYLLRQGLRFQRQYITILTGYIMPSLEDPGLHTIALQDGTGAGSTTRQPNATEFHLDVSAEI